MKVTPRHIATSMTILSATLSLIGQIHQSVALVRGYAETRRRKHTEFGFKVTRNK